MTNATPTETEDAPTRPEPVLANRQLVCGGGDTVHETNAVKDGACPCIECDGAGQVPANEDMDAWEDCSRCKGSGVESCWFDCGADAVVVTADENKVDRHMCAECAAELRPSLRRGCGRDLPCGHPCGSDCGVHGDHCRPGAADIKRGNERSAA